MRRHDYTKYSLAELHEALSTVDGIKYPENKAALEAELKKRIDSGEVEREEQKRELKEHEKEQGYRHFARSAQPWIGLYLMGAPVMLLGGLGQLATAGGWIGYTILGFIVLYVGVAAVAGYGLWKRKNWSRGLAIGVFALQSISVQSGVLLYSLTSALSAFFYISTPGKLEFGLSAALTIGSFQFYVGDLSLPFTISFNLFALFMIWLLVKARQPIDGDGGGINTHPEELEERPDLRP